MSETGGVYMLVDKSGEVGYSKNLMDMASMTESGVVNIKTD